MGVSCHSCTAADECARLPHGVIDCQDNAGRFEVDRWQVDIRRSDGSRTWRDFDDAIDALDHASELATWADSDAQIIRLVFMQARTDATTIPDDVTLHTFKSQGEAYRAYCEAIGRR